MSGSGNKSFRWKSIRVSGKQWDHILSSLHSFFRTTHSEGKSSNIQAYSQFYPGQASLRILECCFQYQKQDYENTETWASSLPSVRCLYSLPVFHAGAWAGPHSQGHIWSTWRWCPTQSVFQKEGFPSSTEKVISFGLLKVTHQPCYELLGNRIWI